MARIVFVQPDGSEQVVDARDGYTVMEVARGAGVRGIVGECGGGAICGTCHVKPEGTHNLPPAGPIELDVLDMEDNFDPELSRLGCQIEVGPTLDGMRFLVATGRS